MATTTAIGAKTCRISGRRFSSPEKTSTTSGSADYVYSNLSKVSNVGEFYRS